MNVKRSATYVLVAIVAFATGAYAGYRWLLYPRLWMGAVGQEHMLSDYALLEYREGSYPDAAKALETYIKYLNGVQPSASSWHFGESPWLDARLLRDEKTLAWCRLAMLHERNGNGGAASQAWQHAEALAREGTWRDPSRNHLRAVVSRLDASHETTTASK